MMKYGLDETVTLLLSQGIRIMLLSPLCVVARGRSTDEWEKYYSVPTCEEAGSTRQVRDSSNDN